MALAALDLLSTVVTTLFSAHSGSLDRLAIHDACTGLRVSFQANSQTFSDSLVDPSPSTIANRRAQLEERIKLAGLWQDQGLVFPSQVGTPLSARNLQRHFKSLLERVGLPKSVRFHDLRHTCATLLLRQGVNPKFVQELLGHADISLTLNVYSHVLPDMGDAAAGAMDDAIG